jgi:hypothetical protein
VTHWYGHQPNFSQFLARYRGYIESPDFQPFIVTLGTRPLAYIQLYDVEAHPDVLGLIRPMSGLGIDFLLEKRACVERDWALAS